MGVENRLSGGLTDVGADVHGIATGLDLDTIHLLAKEDSEGIEFITITVGEIIGMSLGYDEGVSRRHGIEILDGEV